jgi:lysozyme
MPEQSLFASTWVYDFLKSYEKFRPTAYVPTKNDVWTIGWGHTSSIKKGDTCTSDQAEAWLTADMAFAVATIHKHCTVDLTQPQFDALVSLVFNIGVGHFEESTLLRKLNDSNYGGAAQEFLVWDKQAGVELPGLENRRIAEQKRFLS